MVIITIILVAAVLFYARCSFGRAILYLPPSHAVLPELEGGQFIEVSGKDRIARGYLMPASDRARPPILLVWFHGNGSAIQFEIGSAASLRPERAAILLVEYPGYGISDDSSPSEKAIYEDAERVILDVQSRTGITPERTVLLGHSLGAAVAVEMAGRRLSDRMILLSPFTSAREVGEIYYGSVLPRLFLCDRFDSLSKAPAIKAKVLIFHGSMDSVIPFSLGERLSQAFPAAKFFPIPGADHNDILRFSGKDSSYGKAMLAFMNEIP